MKTQNSTKKKMIILGIIVLIVIALAINYWASQRSQSRQREVELGIQQLEFPIRVCNGLVCLNAKKLNFKGGCAVTERGEGICQGYFWNIKEGVQMNFEE